MRPGPRLSRPAKEYIYSLACRMATWLEDGPWCRQADPPTQETIDRAFSRPQRTTKNIAPFGRRRLCVINGKHTGQIGVIDATDEQGRPLRVTGIERTLIDITVRPSYAGGVAEVLEAYRRAADRVQVNNLVAMLRKIDFVYPYEQAIGFYMERSRAYPERRLETPGAGGVLRGVLLRGEPWRPPPITLAHGSLSAIAGLTTTWLPRHRASMSVRRKQATAWSGVSTIGSFSLKLVLSTTGTPLCLWNSLIRS